MPNESGPEYRGKAENYCQCRTKREETDRKQKFPPVILQQVPSNCLAVTGISLYNKENRQLIAGTAMFVFSAVMVAAGMTFFVVVMAAYSIRIITEIALKQCVYIVICIA